MRARGLRQRRAAGEEVSELEFAWLKRLRRTRDDDRMNLVIRLDERGFERRLDRSAHGRSLSARMLEHVGEAIRRAC